MKALYDPFLHGSRRHIGSEVWVSFTLGFLDHYPYHHSCHTVNCLDLAFMGWVILHYHTFLHFYLNLFLHFLLHPFIIRLIPFRLLLPSSIVVSLHEWRVRWCTSPVVGHCSFGCRVESPYSHSPPIFDIAHTEAWHYLLGIWAFVSHCFIHLLPLAFITVWVVRPPWGHEISCLLRRISFGQAPYTNWSTGCRQGSISWGISRIAYCFSISSLRLWSTIKERWCIESRLSRTSSACWFVIFLLGHTSILAWWHRFLHWDTNNPFHQVTLGISVWVGPHIQLGFFIQQLAYERWPGIKFTSIRRPSGCAHWGILHTLSCSLIQAIRSSLIYFRVVFLPRHLHIRCTHWGIPPISFFCGYWMLRNKVDVVLGMNVCDVFSSLTLTICTVMGFWHGMDILDWGITLSFHF